MKTRKFVKSRVTSKLTSITGGALLLLALSGCLISPYDMQHFDSRFDKVPFTVWTADKTKPITINCAPARHGYFPPFEQIATVYPTTNEIFDTVGREGYTASIKMVVPKQCWEKNHGKYKAFIRVLQDGSDESIYTFSKEGLACFGAQIGKTAQWYDALGKGCERLIDKTGEPLRIITITAKADD